MINSLRLQGFSQEWALLTNKRIWGMAIIVAALHLIPFLGAVLFAPEFNPNELRSWSDIVAYVDAGEALNQRQPLYELTSWEDPMTYYYHPAFALGMAALSWIPFRLLTFFWVLLQVGAYLAALRAWYRVLEKLNLPDAMTTYKKWLPLAFVFTEWYVNLFYGNITSSLLLLSGLMVLALLDEKPAKVGLLALLLMLVKPQWLFPLLLPIVFRQWRLLFKILAVLAVAYLVVNGVFVMLVGWEYGSQALEDYATFLQGVNKNFEWQPQTYAFEDMNHSWRQIFISYFGSHNWTPIASEGVKLVMLMLVGWLILRAWRKKQTVAQNPSLVLWFVGLGYLLSMAMLAQLWEVMGSIIVFFFIQSVGRRISLLYLIYALYEIPIILSFITGWEGLFLPTSIPLAMVTLVFLFGILIQFTYQNVEASWQQT